MSRSEGRQVVHFPKRLRLHSAMEVLGWAGTAEDCNDAPLLKDQSINLPILITANGTILSGFGRWQSALFNDRQQISCIEYPLGEEEALQFIISHHQSHHRWNDFIRIRLALALEPNLQQRALGNMRAGGRYKGSANLPEAQHIDVREEIARIAGVGARNVSNVTNILQTAHPRLIEALRDGMLTINLAIKLCKVPEAEQLEQFIRFSEERATNRVIRRTIALPQKEKKGSDVSSLLDALRDQEAQRPGSVAVRFGRHKRTVVLVGEDLSGRPPFQKELHLT